MPQNLQASQTKDSGQFLCQLESASESEFLQPPKSTQPYSAFVDSLRFVRRNIDSEPPMSELPADADGDGSLAALEEEVLRRLLERAEVQAAVSLAREGKSHEAWVWCADMMGDWREEKR